MEAATSLIPEPEPTKAQWMTPELKTAYLNSDFAFIDQSIKKTKEDLDPIALLLESHSDDAFAIVEDDHGNDTAVITTAGETLFASVKEDTAAREQDRKAGKEKTNAICKPTTQVGFYSKSGAQAQIMSSHTIEIVEEITVLALATAIRSIVRDMVVRSLIGRVTGQAAAAAVEAQTAYALKKTAETASKDALARGEGVAAAELALKEATVKANQAFFKDAAKVVPARTWTKVASVFRPFPRVTGGVVGIVVMAIAQVLLNLV